MTATVDQTPQMYSEYKEFLPPFTDMVEVVLTRLVPYYESYAKENKLIEPDEGVYVFLRVCSKERDSRSNIISYSEVLSSVISYELIFHTGVNSLNGSFMSRVRKLCDEEGYEEWEDRNEVFEEMREIIVEDLEDEIMEHVRYMEIGRLNKMLDEL